MEVIKFTYPDFLDPLFKVTSFVVRIEAKNPEERGVWGRVLESGNRIYIGQSYKFFPHMMVDIEQWGSDPTGTPKMEVKRGNIKILFY